MAVKSFVCCRKFNFSCQCSASYYYICLELQASTVSYGKPYVAKTKMIINRYMLPVSILKWNANFSL